MKQIKQMVDGSREWWQEKRAAPVAARLPPIQITQNIRENFGKVTGAIINVPDPDAERLREARAILIERVKAHWIEVAGAARSQQAALQAIESDHQRFVGAAGLMELHKRFMPEAVDFVTQAAAVVAHLGSNGDEARSEIEPAQPMMAIFQGAARSLLILGAPGVGKTVELLQLARSALVLAESEAGASEAPIPVILNLGAWANDQRPLAEWVVQELKGIQYGIPTDVARVWLRNHDLLLLLDGLNELNYGVRQRCVAQINAFVADHGTVAIAVCCRTEEYSSLPVKLTLRQAIQLEPLREVQLATYFAAAGESLRALQRALHADATLHELATTPLMLHMMSIAYAGVQSGEIATNGAHSLEEQRRRLFDLYVARMLRYGGTVAKAYPDQAMIGWLAWLARQMLEHNRPVFLIEQLQPSWLATVARQWVYMIAARVGVGLVVGGVGGLVIGMALGPNDGYAAAFQRGVSEGPLTGVISGMVVAIFDMLWIQRVGSRLAARKIGQIWQSLLKIGLTTSTVSLIVATLFALLLGTSRFLGGSLTTWWEEGQQVGLLSGLSAALLFAFGPQALRYSLSQDIQTVERVSWSKARAWRSGSVAVIVGVAAGAVAAPIAGDTPMIQALTDRGMSPLAVILAMMAMGGGMLGLMGVVFGGFTGTFRKVQKVTPNQGLRLSLINAGMVALLVGAIFGPLSGLLGWLISGGSAGRAISYTFYGLFIGVLAAMWYGLLFALQHGVLRVLLWWGGHTPPVGHYARLLDQAARHIFLQKVGGGYKFVNRYLQEYFAAMAEQVGSRESATPKEDRLAVEDGE